MRAHSGRERVVRAAVVVAMLALLALAISLAPGAPRWSLAWERRGVFASGLALTAAISLGALTVGLLLGAAAGLARMSRSAALDPAAVTYVEFVRGTPFLIQLYVVYYCVATSLHLHDAFGDAEPVVVGIVGLGVFAGAYIAEIVRAGIESIDRGQWEAARSLGLSHRQTLTRVVLPQAVRRMIPPLAGEAVSLVKESSILSVISVAEVTYHARNVAGETYQSFAIYVPLAALYLLVTLPLSWLTRRLERRLAPPAQLPVSRL
jgi:polar amino acid transport system permease protein